MAVKHYNGHNIDRQFNFKSTKLPSISQIIFKKNDAQKAGRKNKNHAKMFKPFKNLVQDEHETSDEIIDSMLEEIVISYDPNITRYYIIEDINQEAELSDSFLK